MFLRLTILAGSAALLTACSPELTPADAFRIDISQYCGKAFAGTLVSEDEVDAGFAVEDIVMHVRDCSESEARIPLHVGENRSRTWIVSATDGGGLRLKHDHRHEDGAPDAISMYGGDMNPAENVDWDDGSYAFPADEFSKSMFEDEGIPDSKQNTWVIELKPDANLFAYQMSRPNRFFRLEFDLSQPVEIPPPAWGHE